MFFVYQRYFTQNHAINATDALNKNLNGRFLVTICLKEARKLFKKEKKLHEIRKVARRTKSCSKCEKLLNLWTAQGTALSRVSHGVSSFSLPHLHGARGMGTNKQFVGALLMESLHFHNVTCKLS